jgi:hypothetical protein
MRRWAWGRGAVAALSMSACLSSFATGAWAQIPRGDGDRRGQSSPESKRTVDVTIVAGGEDTAPLMGTIGEDIGRLGLEALPHLVAFPEPPPAAGTRTQNLDVWIDLASRYEALVIVRSDHLEVRRTIARDGSPAVVREEIGEAVRSAVDAQLAPQEPAPATPPVAPAAPPTPSPTTLESAASLPAPPSRGLALDITVLAGGGFVSSESGLVARVGGGAVLGSRRRLRPSLTVTAQYLVPFDSPVSNVSMRTSIVSLRAVPAIEVLHASWAALDLGAGGGIDIVSVETPNASGVRPESVPTYVDPILTALATAYVALAPGVALTVVAGAEMDLTPAGYFVGPGPAKDTLAPWRVRPVVMAGFTFTALGSGLFAARTP